MYIKYNQSLDREHPYVQIKLQSKYLQCWNSVFCSSPTHMMFWKVEIPALLIKIISSNKYTKNHKPHHKYMIFKNKLCLLFSQYMYFCDNCMYVEPCVTIYVHEFKSKKNIYCIESIIYNMIFQ